MVNKVNGIKVKKNPLVEIFGRGGKEITFQSINYFLFFLFGLATLYPFIYVVKVSMESIKLVNGVPETVYNFSAYGMVLQNAKIYKSFFLTVGIVAAHTLLHLFFTFISAYPLSKKHFRGRNFFLLFVLFTMLFSGGLIPTYILITQVLNWMDNLLVYIVPGIMTGFNIIIVKNFLQEIPECFEEAAKLEGANDFQILIKIYVPLSAPIAATIALWSGVGKWNNWMTGILYITNTDLYMLQNILRDMLVSSSTGSTGQGADRELMSMADNIKMATVVIGTLPIICIYPFVQKYFVKGMLVGSVKG